MAHFYPAYTVEDLKRVPWRDLRIMSVVMAEFFDGPTDDDEDD